jgi:ABC-type lipoprotein release transport system permease subunit
LTRGQYLFNPGVVDATFVRNLGLGDRVIGRRLETKPTEPLTFAVVSLTLIAVAPFACWLPARRAARLDPMKALRHE